MNPLGKHFSQQLNCGLRILFVPPTGNLKELIWLKHTMCMRVCVCVHVCVCVCVPVVLCFLHAKASEATCSPRTIKPSLFTVSPLQLILIFKQPCRDF